MMASKFAKPPSDLMETSGPIVRIAPDEVSISDPEAVNRIYGVKPIFPKVARCSENSNWAVLY